jgi:hypothetical protein
MKRVHRSRVVAEAVAVGGSVAAEVEVVVPAGSAIAGKRSKNAILHGGAIIGWHLVYFEDDEE